VLPLALGFALMSRFAGPRAQQRGVTALIEGCGVQIAGIALLASALATGLNTAPVLALVLIVFGLGQAMVMAPLYGLVLTKVPAAHAGSGGGVMITVQQVGNGTGVAVIGAVYYAVASAYSALAAVLACLVALTTAIAITAVLLGRLNRLTGDVPGGRCS
jgi:predicted MFS family arabinose efflux permease